MTSDRRIVFIINSLTTGGAEHALIDLLAHLEAHLGAYSVHLVLLDSEEEFHSVPRWVKKHVLNTNSSFLWSVASLFTLLKTLAPEIAVSFLNRSNCANVISSKILKYPCVISERTHPTSRFAVGFTAALTKTVMRLTYPHANQIIAVSQGVRDDLISNFAVDEGKIRVIYNPIDGDRICERGIEAPSINVPSPYIVSAGRLVSSKNFHLLIESYYASGVADNLVILGEGEERESLEKLISSLGLEGRVMLPGHIQNPYPIIRGARMFVSSSNLEGFPNTLVEAMALGCPVIATDCDTGPMEILTGKMLARCTNVMFGEYGILVPVNSTDMLSKAIRIGCCHSVTTRYSELGKHRARDFGVRESTEQYWSIIKSYTSSQKTLHPSAK